MARKQRQDPQTERDSDLSKEQKDDNSIMREARKRMERCIEWESDFRKSFVADLKFANADSDNGWQWPDDVSEDRGNRPSLTINKTRQHNLQIINDAKQNKPGVKVSPTGGGATYQAAKVYSGIIRHIEYKSSAEQIYDMATKFQVEGGIGYFRVKTDYVRDDSFDQEIQVIGIDDPMSVYLDPDIKQVDGSDARFGFVFEDIPKDEFEIQYPDHTDIGAMSNLLGSSSDVWITNKYVRVAEYFRKVRTEDTLLHFTVPERGEEQTIRESELKKSAEGRAILKALKADEKTKKRPISVYEVQWFKIAGDKIIDRKTWAGKYVPIIRVLGEETKINGRLDRKGHTRSMKDAQRMYNYWSSAGVEFVALQTVAPWVVAAEAIDGYTQYWNNANSQRNYLPYNAFDESNNPLPPPSRPAPPVMASAYIQGMQISQNEMMMVSGQYQSQFGEKEQAISGVAINARQRQGDRATYHYIDGLAVAIRFLGKILIDLIPKIYDTKRIVMILGEDGRESTVQIDPELSKTPLKEVETDEAEGEAKIIFNPAVGEYAVQSDVGPSYATKRQEAFNAFSQLAAQDEKFMTIAGDLMFKAADFPMADELAERFRRMVPLAALGEAPPQEIQMQFEQFKMQQQSMQATISELMKTIAQKDQALANRAASEATARYQARTQRLGVVANAQPELQNAVLPIAAKTEAEILSEQDEMSMGGNFMVGAGNGTGGMDGDLGIAIVQALNQLAQSQTTMAQILTRPKKKVVTRDGRGKVTGMIEVAEPGAEE